MNDFGLFPGEAGPSSLGPGFDPVYVLRLDFGQVLSGAPANSPAEVVVDEGGRPPVEVDWLVDQIAIESQRGKGIGNSRARARHCLVALPRSGDRRIRCWPNAHS